MYSRGTPRTPGVAVVTGGTAEVGRAAVRELARRDWTSRSWPAGRSAWTAPSRRPPVAGRPAVGVAVDVTDPAGVEAAADQAEKAPGPTDLWVDDAFTGALALRRDHGRGVRAHHHRDLPRVISTASGLRCGGRPRATAAPSKSASRWRTGTSRGRRRTAAPNTRCAGSPTPSGSRLCTRACTSTSARSTCPRSTRRSSTGCRTAARTCNAGSDSPPGRDGRREGIPQHRPRCPGQPLGHPSAASSSSASSRRSSRTSAPGSTARLSRDGRTVRRTQPPRGPVRTGDTPPVGDDQQRPVEVAPVGHEPRSVEHPRVRLLLVGQPRERVRGALDLPAGEPAVDDGQVDPDPRLRSLSSCTTRVFGSRPCSAARRSSTAQRTSASNTVAVCCTR